MTMNLPRPPSPDRFRSDPDGYARDLYEYHSKFAQEIEREMRLVETPAKTPFAVDGIPAPTTMLNGGTAGTPEIINFLGGIYAALLAKGMIRTKVGP